MMLAIKRFGAKDIEIHEICKDEIYNIYFVDNNNRKKFLLSLRGNNSKAEIEKIIDNDFNLDMIEYFITVRKSMLDFIRDCKIYELEQKLQAEIPQATQSTKIQKF